MHARLCCKDMLCWAKDCIVSLERDAYEKPMKFFSLVAKAVLQDSKAIEPELTCIQTCLVNLGASLAALQRVLETVATSCILQDRDDAYNKAGYAERFIVTDPHLIYPVRNHRATCQPCCLGAPVNVRQSSC